MLVKFPLFDIDIY